MQKPGLRGPPVLKKYIFIRGCFFWYILEHSHSKYSIVEVCFMYFVSSVYHYVQNQKENQTQNSSWRHVRTKIRRQLTNDSDFYWKLLQMTWLCSLDTFSFCEQFIDCFHQNFIAWFLWTLKRWRQIARDWLIIFILWIFWFFVYAKTPSSIISSTLSSFTLPTLRLAIFTRNKPQY